MLQTLTLAMLALAPPQAGPQPIQTAADARPRHGKIIEGYYPYWKAAAHPPAATSFEYVTHVLHAFVIPNPDGSLQVPAGFVLPALRQEAHADGAELLVAIGGAGGSGGFGPATSNPGTRAILVQSIASFVQANGYDGVAFDWEYPGTNAERASYTALVAETRSLLGSTATLSVAVAASSWFGQWLEPELADHADHLAVMAYDLAGPWSAASGHHSPGRAGGCASTWGAIESAEYWLNRGVPRSKLVLGVPFYGRSFDSESMCSGYSVAGEAAYSDLVGLTSAGFTLQWDPLAHAPFLTEDSGPSVWTFDNAQSLEFKLDHILREDLAGAMIWEITQDRVGGNHLLLPLLYQKLH